VRHDDFILVQGIVARFALGESFDDLHFWVSDAAFRWRILIVENKGFAGRNSSRFGQKMAEMPKSSVRPLFKAPAHSVCRSQGGRADCCYSPHCGAMPF